MDKQMNDLFKNLKEADSVIPVADNLYENKQHGSLAYPVAFYYVKKLSNMYLGIVRWHWHRELEIMYIIDGCAEFLVNDLSFVLKAGDCLFVNTNIMHAVHPVEGFDCEYISIVFHMNFVFGNGHSELATKYMLPLTNDKAMRAVNLSDNPKAIKFVKQIIDENTQKTFAYELKTKGYLLQIWLLLLEQREAQTKTPIKKESNLQVGLDESRVKQAITYITQHYAENISLEDIADFIHISKSECCRCFKRCLDLSPFEYLLKYRIYSATDLLSDPANNYSISDIAMLTGFNSSSYFNKIFRKYMGCTPSQFKNKKIEGRETHALQAHTDNLPTG